MDWIYVKLVLPDRETGRVQNNNTEHRQVVSVRKRTPIQFFVKSRGIKALEQSMDCAELYNFLPSISLPKNVWLPFSLSNKSMWPFPKTTPYVPEPPPPSLDKHDRCLCSCCGAASWSSCFFVKLKFRSQISGRITGSGVTESPRGTINNRTLLYSKLFTRRMFSFYLVCFYLQRILFGLCWLFFCLVA